MPPASALLEEFLIQVHAIGQDHIGQGVLVLVETVGLELIVLRAAPPALPPVCTPLASLFVPMNHIGFNTEPFSILADRFASSWSSFWTDAYAGKTADCDRGQVHFRLGMWLAGSGYWVSSYLGFSDAMV